MFTVKLVQGNHLNNQTTQVFSCMHYAIWEGDTHTEIILYKDYNTEGGIGYKIASSDIGVLYFDKGYIENINGKTINTVIHFNKLSDHSPRVHNKTETPQLKD